MPVFYRGSLAHITHRAIEVPHRARRSYALGELDGVRAVRDQAPPRSRALGMIALVGAVFAVPGADAVPLPLAVVAGVGLAAFGVWSLFAPTRCCYRLLATAGGRPVVLVRTEDRVEFEKILRGLRRALDYRQDRGMPL